MQLPDYTPGQLGSFAVSEYKSRMGFLSIFLSFFPPLIKMILVSELPLLVKAAQEPIVYSWLIIIFLPCG